MAFVPRNQICPLFLLRQQLFFRLFFVGAAEDENFELVRKDAAVRHVLEHLTSSGDFLPACIANIVPHGLNIDAPERIVQAVIQVLSTQDVHVLAIGAVAHIATTLRQLPFQDDRNP